jgi:hypothetical protein
VAEEHLQGNVAVEAELAGLVHRPHRAFAELLDDVEVAEDYLGGGVGLGLVGKVGSADRIGGGRDFGAGPLNDAGILERVGRRGGGCLGHDVGGSREELGAALRAGVELPPAFVRDVARGATGWTALHDGHDCPFALGWLTGSAAILRSIRILYQTPEVG